MRSIKLQVKDSIYQHIMFLLKNINSEELQILEDKTIKKKYPDQEEIKAFSNHTINLIEEWKDNIENDIWI